MRAIARMAAFIGVLVGLAAPSSASADEVRKVPKEVGNAPLNPPRERQEPTRREPREEPRERPEPRERTESAPTRERAEAGRGRAREQLEQIERDKEWKNQ